MPLPFDDNPSQHSESEITSDEESDTEYKLNENLSKVDQPVEQRRDKEDCCKCKRKRGQARKGRGKGKGGQKRKCTRDDEADEVVGAGGGTEDPLPYWYPDCKRNARQYVPLQRMGEVQWSRKERVEMMKTGGLKGVIGYMGAGFGGERWDYY